MFFFTRFELWEWDEFSPREKMRWVSDQSSFTPSWEPTTFIFGGYNPYVGGVKPSFFMVLGSKGMSYFCDFFVVVFAILRNLSLGNYNEKNMLLLCWDCNGKPSQPWFTVSENHHHSFSSARKKEISFIEPTWWNFPCFKPGLAEGGFPPI